MNTQPISLRLLGASIGIGAVLSLTPITSVQAGSFNRNIVDENGQTLGHIEFSWDDAEVVGGLLSDFQSLTTFELTDDSDRTYDLNFALAARAQDFKYNLTTGSLTAIAYNLVRNVGIQREGFMFRTIPPNAIRGSQVVPNSSAPNYAFVPALNNNATLVSGVSLQEPEPKTPNSIPENSLTTAVLIIAGLVVISSKKKL